MTCYGRRRGVWDVAQTERFVGVPVDISQDRLRAAFRWEVYAVRLSAGHAAGGLHHAYRL